MKLGADTIRFTMVQDGTEPDPPSDDGADAGGSESGGAIERLRASRRVFEQKVYSDGKETGRLWLMTKARYEQVRCLLFLIGSRSGDADVLSGHGEAFLEALPDDVDALSELPGYSREGGWNIGFLDGFVEAWEAVREAVEA